MSEPIVFISHLRIKEGKLDRYTELQHDVTPQLESDKPRTLAFLVYLSEDATRITIVHLVGDADSMDAHVAGAEERGKMAWEFLEPEGWDIYGSPSDQALETMRREAASAGVALNVQPNFTAGFLRTKPA